MYVCLCTPTTELQIKEAISQGAITLEDLQMELGVCCNCCACRETIEEIINAESGNATP